MTWLIAYLLGIPAMGVFLKVTAFGDYCRDSSEDDISGKALAFMSSIFWPIPFAIFIIIKICVVCGMYGQWIVSGYTKKKKSTIQLDKE
jgi:ABC-type methionine transport system permease subunit